MKSPLRMMIAFLILLGVVVALIWSFRSSRAEEAADDNDAAIEGPSHTTQQDGHTVLTFDENAQRDNGIVVKTLPAEQHRGSIQANGVILQLQPLLDAKTARNTALMQLAKAIAAARASQAEYDRLRGLNQKQKNVSDKAVESARVAAESDAATLKDAEQSIAVLDNSIQLNWGTTLVNWLTRGSPQLDQLLSQRDFLLQVTAINSGSWRPAPQVWVQLPNGNHAVAQFLSTLPQLDPRLQAPSMLYIVAAHPGLVAGLNLSVSLPTGPLHAGVVVPEDAVVWSEGSAWCYVETTPGRFLRKEIPTDNPVPAGWFVHSEINANARVVVSGAQTLLSEELHPQIQGDDD